MGKGQQKATEWRDRRGAGAKTGGKGGRRGGNEKGGARKRKEASTSQEIRDFYLQGISLYKGFPFIRYFLS